MVVRAIRRNLQHQVGNGPHTVMYCTKCGSQYSANAGDYWDTPDEHVFRCCNRIMLIGRVVCHFEEA